MESAVSYDVTDWVLGTGDSTFTKKAKAGIKFKAVNQRQTDREHQREFEWAGGVAKGASQQTSETVQNLSVGNTG